MKRTLFALAAAIAVLGCGHATAAGVDFQIIPSKGAPIYVQLPDGTFAPAQADADGNILVNGGGGSGGSGIVTYSTTDKGGTITTGGTAQSAIASNASRKIWCIQNDPAEGENLTVRVSGTASSTTGTVLPPGAQACSAPNALDTGAVSVLAATTGHRFRGFEGQ